MSSPRPRDARAQLDRVVARRRASRSRAPTSSSAARRRSVARPRAARGVDRERLVGAGDRVERGERPQRGELRAVGRREPREQPVRRELEPVRRGLDDEVGHRDVHQRLGLLAERRAVDGTSARDARAPRGPRAGGDLEAQTSPPRVGAERDLLRLAARPALRDARAARSRVASRGERVAHRSRRARPRRPVRTLERYGSIRAPKPSAPKSTSSSGSSSRCSSASRAPVREQPVEIARRRPPRRPVAADDHVGPQRAVELGARDEVVDPEAVAVLVVEDRAASPAGRLLVAGREHAPAVDLELDRGGVERVARAADAAVSSYSCQRNGSPSGERAVDRDRARTRGTAGRTARLLEQDRRDVLRRPDLGALDLAQEVDPGDVVVVVVGRHDRLDRARRRGRGAARRATQSSGRRAARSVAGRRGPSSAS